MKDTLVVNLIGAPGVGKSTVAAHLFAELKWRDINCEMAREFAKDLVWEGRQETLKNQLYVFGKQFHKISRLNGKVEVIITDSPLLLSYVYNNLYCKDKYLALNNLILEQHNKFNNYNILLERDKAYNPKGRNETEEESNKIQELIINTLNKHKIKYKKIAANRQMAEHIVCDVMAKMRQKG